MKKICIAIDGPASAGKSTIAKIIAKEKNYIYLDTGAMYRATTWACMNNNVNLNDEKNIVELLRKNKISFQQSNNGQLVFWNDQNITEEIRSNEVTNNVSEVSAHQLVREFLVSEQQKYAEDGGIVMDGRDIGTTVLPNAEVKIFLIASVEERAQRRYKENIAKGIATNLEDLKLSIEKRDEFDSNRKVSPLKKADDAIEIDTTGLSIEEVVDKINLIINTKIS